MIKGSIHKEDITIINIYAPNRGAPQYIRQLLTAIKEENDKEEISKENDNIILPMGAAAIGGTSYIIYKNRKKKE